MALGNGRADKDDTHGQEAEEDETRAEKLHETDAGETAYGKSGLGTGKEFGANVRRCVGTGVFGVVDEEAGNGDLGTGVAELGEGGVEEVVLLPEGLFFGFGVGFFGLEFHVCVVLCQLISFTKPVERDPPSLVSESAYGVGLPASVISGILAKKKMMARIKTKTAMAR